MFNRKDKDVRIRETIEFIQAYEAPPGDLRDLIAVLRTWQTAAAYASERKRISDAMHQGPFGDAGRKQLRRATILLRAAVLRNDSSKTQREVNGTGDGALAAYFERILRQCINYTQTVPPWLEVSKAPDALQKSRDDVQKLTSKLVRDLGGRSDAWIKVLEDNQDKLSESQAALYAKWKAAGVRKDQLDAAHAAVLKYLYLPTPSDTDTAIVQNVDWLKDAKTIIKRGDGGLNDLQAGGELYILGHGNFGAGIGTHDDHLGANRLATSLDEDGLPKTPDHPIWVYLWACWTATHVRRAWGALGKREPYARRLARAMARRGFEKCYLVGFGGSVGSGEVTQVYQVSDAGTTKAKTKNLSDCDFVVYEVLRGDYNRVAGEDWTTKAAPTAKFWKDYDIAVVQRDD